MKIAVLGAGAWGTALSLLLAQQGDEISLWSHRVADGDTMQKDRENHRYLPGFSLPDNITVNGHLAKCLEGADGILMAVPSHAFREVLTNALPYLNAEQFFAWASKGLDTNTHSLLSDVVIELRGADQAFAILSGPSFAKEVAQGKPTAVTLAHNNEACAEFWQNKLHSGSFRVYTMHDIVGAQLAGAVKNVLAIATGVADGLGLGANTQAALITRGLKEMMNLGTSMGAHSETFMGLAGMGDLILTCTDNQSRNRRFGFAIGQGRTIMQAMDEIDQVVEGLGTTKLVHELSKSRGVEMPITEQVYQVLYQKLSPQKAVEALLSRKAKDE
jgi:glycerol-3-phosphate dehydrogenase (NAD(P)+)